MTKALDTAPRAADGAGPIWFVRLLRASPLAPAWTAAWIGVGLTLVEFGVAALSGGARTRCS